MGKLVEVERELREMLAENERGVVWTSVAELLVEVDAEELWRERDGCRSYSAWLREFAEEQGKTDSLFWRYKAAGEYWNGLRETHPDLPPLAEAKGSAKAIVGISKVCGNDADQGATLVERVQSGELTQKGVEEMWRAARKTSAPRKSRHDPRPMPASGDTALTLALTQAVVSRAEEWIWGAETAEQAEARKRADAPRQFLRRDAVCVRTVTEFPIRVETAERARQIDVAAVCAENQTTSDWMEPVLRGVEIKVSEHDLRRDEKMGDYALYVDYMYLAVPTPLVALAGDSVPRDWGVMAYDSDADELSVVREPERLPAPRREQALGTMVVKLAKLGAQSDAAGGGRGEDAAE